MKKLLKRLLNNKGLTLTELIVALFLTSVILAIAVGMLAPVRNLMNTMKSNAHMDTISSTVDEYVRGTLQSATNVMFVTLNSGNDFQNDTDKSAVNQFFTDKAGDKIQALAVVNVGTDTVPVYRILDFEKVSTFAELQTRLSTKTSYADYSIFNEPFYGGDNVSCAVELYNSGSWLQVASQCKKENNGKMEIANQKHVLNFKLLNGTLADVSGAGNKTDADLNEEDAEIEIAGHCYLILYTLFDWSTLSTTP